MGLSYTLTRMDGIHGSKSLKGCLISCPRDGEQAQRHVVSTPSILRFLPSMYSDGTLRLAVGQVVGGAMFPLDLLSVLAEFESGLIYQRFKAAIDKIRCKGRWIGKPRVTIKRGFSSRLGATFREEVV